MHLFTSTSMLSLDSEGPLESIVSMGSRHPVPQQEVYQRDGIPPLDLIQLVYQMERDRKVRADDITVPARHQVQYSTQSGNTRFTRHTHRDLLFQ